jgi:membrane-associated protein
MPHHHHVGKHLWMIAVVIGAAIVGLAIWFVRRRAEAAKPAE